MGCVSSSSAPGKTLTTSRGTLAGGYTNNDTHIPHGGAANSSTKDRAGWFGHAVLPNPRLLASGGLWDVTALPAKDEKEPLLLFHKTVRVPFFVLLAALCTSVVYERGNLHELDAGTNAIETCHALQKRIGKKGFGRVF
jgi:hypothetical protein